jgi:nucleoside-diphosphate-sugar epimerase
MKILVGDTGLIGTTLKEKLTFNHTFNSKNITTFNDYEYKNATLYLSCLPATKWLVNKNIKSDIENIRNIVEILSHQKFDRVILFSTIDVYTDTPLLSDENTPIHFKSLSYGTNRYLFELLVQEFVKTSDLKIFRLPALFSKKIKKNVLYDLIHDNNVEQINLNSAFQWYDLENLTKDIDYFIQNFEHETLFNLFTEPLDTTDIVSLFPHYTNIKYSTPTKFEYNFKTVHYESGYIKNKEEVLNEIKELVNEISGK